MPMANEGGFAFTTMRSEETEASHNRKILPRLRLELASMEQQPYAFPECYP